MDAAALKAMDEAIRTFGGGEVTFRDRRIFLAGFLANGLSDAVKQELRGAATMDDPAFVPQLK